MPGGVPIGMDQGGATFHVDASGHLNIASGRVTFPPNLARGYIPLSVAGVKTTATASGIVTAWTTAVQPKLLTHEVTSGVTKYEWATANVAPLIYKNLRLPDDMSTAGPLRLVYTAESVSGATNDINWQIRAGTATANLGATAALSSTPIERTVAVASGSVPASGFIGVTVFPGAHATGAVSLYAAGISYAKRTS